MASVYQKRGTWYARVKDGTGAWRSHATWTTTKTEARRLAEDMERRAERQRHGLEPLPAESTQTLGQLCEWWLDERCPAQSREGERNRLTLHVLKTPLAALPLPQVTAAAVDARLREMERDGAAPASLNKLRAVLHTVFARAAKARLWTGANPLEAVEPRRVPRRAYDTLRAEEVAQLLPHVPEDWRGFFAAALLTGMRKGELCGLQKRDVDLARGFILVGRSYERETTKGGHTDAIPIAPGLVPYLEEALESKGDLVFPWPDGRMRSTGTDPQKILRTALARAGLLIGYDHTCRRCSSRGTPHVEQHPDATRRECPRCGMALWPRPLPRRLRFHDLRHSTATLLLRAGVDAHRVQRIMRHRDVRTTLGTYGHLDVEDLRAAVGTLPGGPARPAGASADAEPVVEQVPAQLAAGALAAGPFVTRLLPAGAAQPAAGQGTVKGHEKAPGNQKVTGGKLERENGFEPSTLALARRCSTAELFPQRSRRNAARPGVIEALRGGCQASSPPAPGGR
jgi:integrase